LLRRISLIAMQPSLSSNTTIGAPESISHAMRVRLSQTECKAAVLAAINSASAVLTATHGYSRHFHETAPPCQEKNIAPDGTSAVRITGPVRVHEPLERAPLAASLRYRGTSLIRTPPPP
jgi:hypothetical protein